MSNNIDIYTPQSEKSLELPLSEERVAAGFPSPADDYATLKLDLNRELIKNPASTFYARVSGVSMIDDGINDGDLLVIHDTGAQGFSISCWGETSEINMQSYKTVYQMGYGSVIAWNHERTELMHEKNVFDTFDMLYRLRNREILAAPHIEVTHAVVKEWKNGRKYYCSMDRADKDYLTVGEYLVSYKNGKRESFPVIFSINITHKDISLERCESSLAWHYVSDGDYPTVASRCNITKEPDGIWYTTVMPLSGEAEKCEYIPRVGFEDYVKIKSVKFVYNAKE